MRTKRRDITRSTLELAVAGSGAAEVETDAEAVDVWRAVATLPPMQRAAVVLRYVEDLSADEIGDILGCEASTVRVHLTRARRTLGAHLGEQVDDVAR